MQKRILRIELEHAICPYDKVTDKCVEHLIKFVQQTKLHLVFNPNSGDTQFEDVYDITPLHAIRIKEHLGIELDLERYRYQLTSWGKPVYES